MIRLSVCPHDISKGIEKWKRFAKELEEKVKQPVNLEITQSFKEWDRYLEKGEHDLYYTGPRYIKSFLSQGYIPVAKFKGQRDSFFLIMKEDPPQGEILVALPFLRPAGYVLLSLDIENIKLIFTNNFYDAFLLLKNGKVHASVMYDETWKEIEEEEKRDFKIIKSYIFESCHMFVVRPQLYESIKEALLSFEDIEELQEKDISSSLKLFDEFDKFIKLWSYSNIAKTLDKTSQIGILIYKDKIVYASEGALKLTGYKKEEILGAETTKVAEKLIAPEYGEIIRTSIERAMSGNKKGSIVPLEIPLLKGDGTTLWTLTFIEDILYHGDYYKIALLIDITKRKRLENLYTLLKSINKIITESILEEELFERVCRTLVYDMGLRFVWIGVHDAESEIINPIYHYGYEDGYLQELKISIREEDEGVTCIAYKENRIVINPDTRKAYITTQWKESMLKRGYLSSVAIPIKKDNKVSYILNLYASEPLFFEEENKAVLEEIKSDIEFALKRMEELRQSLLAIKTLENASWVMITDKEGKIIYVNDAVSKISGYSKEELLGEKPNIFKSGYHSKEFYQELWEKILSGKTFHSTFINRKKGKEIFHLEQTIYPLKLPDGTLRFISVGLDVTREVMLSSDLERLTLYDPVTGLFNNKTFLIRGKELLRNSDIYFLAIIDLYNFSSINRIYGIESGDVLLKKVGERLKEEIKNRGIISRISADSFGIICGPLKEEKEAIITIEKINETFSKPFDMEGKEVFLSTNIGTVLYPRDGRTIEELIEKASLALLEAKKAGEGEIRFFEPSLEDKVKEYLSASRLVEKAINKGLFIFHYQPYYRARDLSLSGFEALVRIKDEKGTIYSPRMFIDYLENSRFLRPFEDWAITEAMKRTQKWNLPISVNISAKTLDDWEFWERLLKVCNISPINIEITERAFVENYATLSTIHKRLRECENIKLVLDDFGTGYSSLAQLTSLPIDILKVDISLVSGLTENLRKRIIIKNVINLSKDLGVETVAEGVETQKELEILQEMGCTYVQGFLLSKPLTEEEVEKLLLERRLKT
ncbi:MAG: EAL domain-containing protein [Synergistetes bacterium]|nr:EAL domain-containing protein [Synergistota bacterium]MDW8191641.1 EAL domain-containing protein [Synergistota bacterium]